MPLFWMKMIKPNQNVPKGTVCFEVHPQMTTIDIKQYLEKIYEVEVAYVTTGNQKGTEKKHPLFGYIKGRERDPKFAFVQLKNETFEFPDLFKEKKSEQGKMLEQYKEMTKKFEDAKDAEWQRQDVPSWFR